MADLGKGTPEERLLALEKWARNVTRSRTGFSALPGKNTIGQDTNVTGDMTITGILTAAGISTVDISVHDHETDAQGGQLDHGAALTGLLDDDHPQYLDTFRHDTTARHTLGTVVPVVSILAGDGLAGGGELTVNRTLTVDESAAFDWTGTHVFNNTVGIKNTLTARSIIPEATDTYDIGSSTMLWRKGWLSELDTVLFAQNTQVLLGGWFVVSKGEGTLIADLAAADTTCDFGQAMTVGDFIELRSSLAVEYIQVGSLVSGTIYNITRNLDGSGANDWPAGIAYRINGQAGNGRIELNAYESPRLQMLRQGGTYNSQSELIRAGDLNGNWGFTAENWGIAIGEYAYGKANIIADQSGNIYIRNYSEDVLTLSGSQATIKIMAGATNADRHSLVFHYTGESTPSGLLHLISGAGMVLGNYANHGNAEDSVSIVSQNGYIDLQSGTGKSIALESGGKIELFSSEQMYLSSSKDAVLVVKTGPVTITGASNEKISGTAEMYGAISLNLAPQSVDISGLSNGLNTFTQYIQASTLTATSAKTVPAASSLFIKDPIAGSNVTITNKYSIYAEGKIRTNSDISAGGMISSAGYANIGTGLYVGNSAGGNPGTGNVRYTGALQSYKNSTAYTGYIYVPLGTPLNILSGTALGAGWTNYAVTSYGMPSGAKAVKLLVGAQWTAAGNNYALTVNKPGGEYSIYVNSYSANTICWIQGDTTIVSDYFAVNVIGAATSLTWIKILGYYI